MLSMTNFLGVYADKNFFSIFAVPKLHFGLYEGPIYTQVFTVLAHRSTRAYPQRLTAVHHLQNSVLAWGDDGNRVVSVLLVPSLHNVVHMAFKIVTFY